MRKLSTGQISSGGYTFYCPDMSDETLLKGSCCRHLQSTATAYQGYSILLMYNWSKTGAHIRPYVRCHCICFCWYLWNWRDVPHLNVLDTDVSHCRYLCRSTKMWIFKSLVLPALLYGFVTWILTRDVKSWTEAFGNKCHDRIIEYCWFDCVSNQQLLSET